MTINTDHNHTINSLYFKPLLDVYSSSKKRFHCPGIHDLEYAQLGVLRCLSHAKSGHEFLQHHADFAHEVIDPSHFFKALKSSRRLGNIASINALLRAPMGEFLADPFEQFNELHGFDIYAADGHYHHAAAFDPKPVKAGSTAEATGHFFRLDLRSHHLGYFDLGVANEGKKRTHDMTVLKRATLDSLRNGAAVGRKVIYAWDKACIDYHLWSRLKHSAGVYFITREKSNSAARICSGNRIDVQNTRNKGIESDNFVGTNNAEMMRRIVYIDSRDGTRYTYLTNEMTLAAHQLVIIYKHRWDIEKVFYQLKSKMEERKSWASSETAKRAHAIFECLAHNLSVIIEEGMKRRGLEDNVEPKKERGRLNTRRNREGKMMKPAETFIAQAISRASHRTARFIRWLRANIYKSEPLEESIQGLKRVWEC